MITVKQKSIRFGEICVWDVNESRYVQHGNKLWDGKIIRDKTILDSFKGNETMSKKISPRRTINSSAVVLLNQSQMQKSLSNNTWHSSWTGSTKCHLNSCFFKLWFGLKRNFHSIKMSHEGRGSEIIYHHTLNPKICFNQEHYCKLVEKHTLAILCNNWCWEAPSFCLALVHGSGCFPSCSRSERQTISKDLTNWTETDKEAF